LLRSSQIRPAKGSCGYRFQRKIGQVLERLLGANDGQLRFSNVSPQHLNHFEIQELWSVQRLTPAEGPFHDHVAGMGREQKLEDRRGIDDDHRVSRSFRTASAGGTLGDTAFRDRNRRRSSSIVGRSVDFRISSMR